MKTIINFVVLSLFIAFNCKAEVAIIVHPNNTNTLDQFTLAQIFLGKTEEFPDGSRAVPINQEEGSKTMSEFSKNVLKKSERQLKAYWSKVLFTGKGVPPKNVKGNAEVIDMIAKDPTLIGYVDASEVNDTVKVLGTY